MIFGLVKIPFINDVMNYLEQKAFNIFVYEKNIEFDDEIYTNDEINKSNKRPIITEQLKISELKKLLKPGDMIEFENYILNIKAYGHWGLFLGIKKDRYIVIHLAKEYLSIKKYWYQLLNIFQQNSGDMTIHLTYLENAAFTNQVGRINNYLDSEKFPNSAKHIRKIAFEALKKEPKYCLISNNCEHFVTELRYNEKISLQTKPLQIFLTTIYQLIDNY